MRYISTRGGSAAISFAEVVLSGLAPDGGLYVPETLPLFAEKEISSWTKLSYQELAAGIMEPFIGDSISPDDLSGIIEKSYKTFRHPHIAPLVELAPREWILELFHGPTLAFKDFALQFLGNLLDYLLERSGEEVVIIGATSGDTGSAAIEGCRNCKHITLFMLHPHGRVSEVQRRQMTTVLSPNIHNLAVETHFDDCQEMVKTMFRDSSFAKGKRLVAVNSINWARIMAQIVYYFYAALKLGAPDEAVSFSVPTGNFGDIYAGYVAHKMGLPVKKLIAATNRNDILHRFFQNNDYSKKNVTPTISPSMDIQVSSNFERLLFDIHGRDGRKIDALMDGFYKTGKLSVAPDVFERGCRLFSSHASDDAETRKTIANVYGETGYICDPHTATGIAAARAHTQSASGQVTVLATAHPAKFPDAVRSSIGITVPLPPHLDGLQTREEKFTRLPNSVDAIKSYISGHI